MGSRSPSEAGSVHWRGAPPRAGGPSRRRRQRPCGDLRRVRRSGRLPAAAASIRCVADEDELPRLATAPALEAAGAAGLEREPRQLSLQTRISSAMVGMKKEFYGKGPERARTFINDEYVFVVMEGGLTRNEQTLLAAGEHKLVRSYRLRFQEAMTATTVGAIEEIIGRKVLTYQSQILFEPVRAIEIFVLDS